jgi:hypothetical protein
MGIAAKPRPIRSEIYSPELPTVHVAWSGPEIASLTKLLSQPAPQPTTALVWAMKGDA